MVLVVFVFSPFDRNIPPSFHPLPSHSLSEPVLLVSKAALFVLCPVDCGTTSLLVGEDRGCFPGGAVYLEEAQHRGRRGPRTAGEVRVNLAPF